MSNQTFHGQRFKQYSKAYLTENKRTYAWFFAIIGIIYFLILLMVGGKRYSYELQMVMYNTGLLITGTIFSVRYFAILARGESALLALMQPVATFEKWLLAVLTIVIAYPLLYTLCFSLMTLPILASVEDKGQLYTPFINWYSMDSFYEIVQAQVYVCIAYVSLTGYALTTSTLFKRSPIIKSIALAFALFLGYLFTLMITQPESKLFFYFTNGIGFTDGLTVIEAVISILVSVMLWIITPTLLWWASFRALKERDL